MSMLKQAGSLARRGSRRLSQVFVRKPGSKTLLSPEDEANIKFIDDDSEVDSDFEFNNQGDDDGSDDQEGGFLGTVAPQTRLQKQKKAFPEGKKYIRY